MPSRLLVTNGSKISSPRPASGPGPESKTRKTIRAAPPALAGNATLDLTSEPLGSGSEGEPVYLRDIWPSNQEIQAIVDPSVVGGVVTEIGDDVIDGSVRSRLQQMRSGLG